MTTWDVQLVFIEDKSKKFWRARKDKTDLYVNWGRIGTDGQTQLKEFDSVEACEKEYDKLVDSKRKKGYVDDGGAEEAPTELPKESKSKSKAVDLGLDGGGRKVEVRLAVEGNSIRTIVVEKFKTPADAQATLARIQQAMEADGYRSVKRDEL